jgi:hypothetical protein
MSGFYDPNSPGFEPDIDDEGAGAILIYVVVISALFFASLGGLFIYFRWEADTEISRKVLTVDSDALKELHAREQAQLQGTAVAEGHKAISIDEAMKRTVQELQTQAK